MICHSPFFTNIISEIETFFVFFCHITQIYLKGLSHFQYDDKITYTRGQACLDHYLEKGDES